jgi:hypothetical protein
MYMQMRSVLAFVGLMAVGLPLLADIDNGLYLGVGLHEAEVDAGQVDDSARSGHATLGYRYNRFMATEFGLYDLGDFSQSAVVGPVAGKAEYSGWVSGIALVPRLPFWIFDLYARLGLQYYNVDSQVVTSVGGVKDDSTGVNAYGSLGGAVNLGRNWSAYLEYSRFYTEERVDSAALGVRYHF